MNDISTVSPEQTVLIAGPTASGKSALAMELAQRQDRIIVNADALQVYSNWRILTARPSAADHAAIPHSLYGHVAGDAAYSVGQWLREVMPILLQDRPVVIVGGTGLYFSALTEGLADIPQTPPVLRREGDELLARDGIDALIGQLDSVTRSRIDLKNPARVQRAWEVQRATGKGLAAWQDETPDPILPLDRAHTMLLTPDVDNLNQRIERRFDQMLTGGAIEEARANLAGWSPDLPSAKAIGATELIAHLSGDLTLQQVRDSAVIATRQYAKRQRSWFRNRMGQWRTVQMP